MRSLAQLPREVRQYLLITANYWAFTLTDGALRMLVVLHFHELGYSPLEIALLFIFYEFFGVVTNLLGGWLGAHLGLNRTMNIGLALQIAALSMLLVPTAMLTVTWVMAAQALSGIAKDLNKMSAKSAVKLLVPADAPGRLYRWVALLTGSKNALKGAGFFMGGALLAALGFRASIAIMVAGLACALLCSLLLLRTDLGKTRSRPRFSELLSKSRAINYLSAARLFLFGARDVWFVVALPVHLASVFAWDYVRVSSFLALWIIGYGIVQGLAPRITSGRDGHTPDGRTAFWWAAALALIPAIMAVAPGSTELPGSLHAGSRLSAELGLVAGLLVFGVFFAINSSLHSFLIVSYASQDGVSLDVGFYYMANAAGRLLGTVLSGWVYQEWGLPYCLGLSALFVAVAALLSLPLPRRTPA